MSTVISSIIILSLKSYVSSTRVIIRMSLRTNGTKSQIKDENKDRQLKEKTDNEWIRLSYQIKTYTQPPTEFLADINKRYHKVNNGEDIPSVSPALLSDRLHRDPPQVKMTARMNSRPQSFTPYAGSSMGWTPATRRQTASTTAFHIVPQIIKQARSSLNKRRFFLLSSTLLSVSLFARAMTFSVTQVWFIKGFGAPKGRHANYACRPSVREQQISKRDTVRDLYGDKKRTKDGINNEYVRGLFELIVFQHVKHFCHLGRPST